MSKLDGDALVCVLSHLEPHDLKRCACVGRGWEAHAVEAADVRAEQRAVEPHARVPVDRAEVEQRRVAVGVGAPRVVEHRAVPRALRAEAEELRKVF